MHRRFAFLTSFVLFTAAAAAQCLSVASPGTTLGSGDETLFGPVAMGISFPMAGAAGPYTHCVVNTNGVLYLTTGGAAVDANLSEWGDDPASLSGAAGASPRIAPFWSDLITTAPGGFVAIDTSVAGRCAVTWVQAREFFGVAAMNFRAELFSTGVVQFSYSGGIACETVPALVGVSVGNAIALPGAADLSAGPLGTGVVWQQFDPNFVLFDLDGNTITFTPSGGGYQVSTTCQAASLRPYGAGCYAVATESFYQYFPTAAAAAAALNGQSLRLVPAANGYVANWGGGTYVVPPGGATVLPANDDDQTLVTPTPPLPVPGGSAAQLYVHTNGFVSTAASNDDGVWNTPAFNDYTPSGQFRNAPATAFWSWHDYNAASGTGRVKSHQAVVGADTILYVTWDAVESYAVPEVANPSTFQFQFNLTTGVVTYVWQALTAIGTAGSPTFPESHLIGWSPGGASLDPGSIALATALPLTTRPDQQALALSASPAPVINPSTLVNFTVDQMPAYSPGVYASAVYFSFTVSPGVDLGFIDAPGCSAFIGSLDAVLGVPISATPSSSVSLNFDNVIFMPGNTFYIQAISVFPPSSLPNGQNLFGLVVSNAIRIYVNTF